MNRRYFVTYKHWNGGTTETSTYALGRFYDLDTADRRARERWAAPEYEILEVRPETDFEATMYKINRFFMRSFRITCAAVIAFFAYIWLSDSGPKIGDIPLGDLSLNMVVSALSRGALFLCAIWLCLIVAFGDGPQDDR